MQLSKLVIVAVMATLAACGCLGGEGVPTSPPAYIDDVYATDSGQDGISIYFILADEAGHQTAAPGYVHIKVSDKTGPLFDGGKNVTVSEFQEATLGRGAFEHEALIHNVGRLPLRRAPSGLVDVEVTFRTSEGETLAGKTTTCY